MVVDKYDQSIFFVIKTMTFIGSLVGLVLSIYAYLIPPQPGDYRIAAISIGIVFSSLLIFNVLFDIFWFNIVSKQTNEQHGELIA